ncbi:MAG TPA: alpha-ketoglutarate-dependent dioxygenase AlkB [Vicinamibacterales bacterium]|nr:alpha-ketoglutarate-dependent dioxygenase AlkB [Vicinamibacterales bacterium]
MLPRVQIGEGLTLFPSRLPSAAQRELWATCRALADGPVPMYVPTVRGGRKMSVGMLCLGRHWNGLTYRYEATRSDFDGLAVPPLPSRFVEIARGAAADAGFEMSPDLCIMNYYDADAKMGVHQDKDERPETIAAGVPIVSISLGDAARFVIGGLSRRDPTSPIVLRSGDVLVMGGPSRLRYHGVTRILPGTAPEGTGPGRFNLTFRQW